MTNIYTVDSNFCNADNVPETYGRETSYYQELAKLVTYVNALYEQYVVGVTNTTELTTSYNELVITMTELNQQFTDFTNGVTIPDGSVTLAKLSADCLFKIQDFVAESVNEIASFVTFGLSDDGYFVANIPSSWSAVEFSTDEFNRLVLKF